MAVAPGAVCPGARPAHASAIRLLGQLDHTGRLGWKLAARHWPQSTQIVVPLADLAAGQRIEGILPPQSRALRTCSVSWAQPRQWRRSPPSAPRVGAETLTGRPAFGEASVQASPRGRGPG